MERMSANMGKLLEEQQFDSIEEAQAFLDQTLLEGGGLLPEVPSPNTPLEKAQAIVYEALETESTRKRIQLARRALKTSGDCADAYMLLAEEDAGSLEETRELYQKGVEAESGRWEEKRSRKMGAISGASWRPAPICVLVRGWPSACGSLGNDRQP